MLKPAQSRGYRYQVSDYALVGVWFILDTSLHDSSDWRRHPTVATELSRAAARRKAQELNLLEEHSRDTADRHSA